LAEIFSYPHAFGIKRNQCCTSRLKLYLSFGAFVERPIRDP
jgi:hypothetical protein